MKNQNVLRTNYFNKPSTWILRGLRFAIAMVFLYLLDLRELSGDSNILFFGYFVAALLAIALIVWPTDELMLDGEKVYFERRSLWPELNRTKEYKISDLKGVGTYNVAKPVGAFALFVPIWDVHRVEIIFTDDSSISHDVMIPKRRLREMLLTVRERINKKTLSV